MYVKILCTFAFVLLLVRYGQGDKNESESHHVSHRTEKQYPIFDKRPFYNIAHMSNSIKKTIDFLRRGANAVEVDVTFKDDDILLYHGSPCDCFRFCWDKVSLSDYLMFIRRITTPENPEYEKILTVVYFDLKLKSFGREDKYKNGIRFANYLAKYIFNEFPVQTTINFVIAISYVDDVDFVIGFTDRLKELNIYNVVKNYVGYDCGVDKDLERISALWKNLNITNVWQGEGITNCISPIIGDQLPTLTRIRKSPNSYFSKVYRWTIDLTDAIVGVLSFSVDGIMTNHPERVLKILQREGAFQRAYRLATIYDNPFEKFRSQDIPELENYRRPAKMANILNDFKDFLIYYMRDIWQSLFR